MCITNILKKVKLQTLNSKTTVKVITYTNINILPLAASSWEILLYGPNFLFSFGLAKHAGLYKAYNTNK